MLHPTVAFAENFRVSNAGGLSHISSQIPDRSVANDPMFQRGDDHISRVSTVWGRKLSDASGQSARASGKPFRRWGKRNFRVLQFFHETEARVRIELCRGVRRLAATCNFGDLRERMRDKIVRGFGTMRYENLCLRTENSRSRNMWTGAKPWNRSGGKRSRNITKGRQDIRPRTNQCRCTMCEYRRPSAVIHTMHNHHNWHKRRSRQLAISFVIEAFLQGGGGGGGGEVPAQSTDHDVRDAGKHTWTTVPVHAFGRQCWRCGGWNHFAAVCSYAKAQVNFLGPSTEDHCGPSPEEAYNQGHEDSRVLSLSLTPSETRATWRMPVGCLCVEHSDCFRVTLIPGKVACTPQCEWQWRHLSAWLWRSLQRSSAAGSPKKCRMSTERYLRMYDGTLMKPLGTFHGTVMAECTRRTLL